MNAIMRNSARIGWQLWDRPDRTPVGAKPSACRASHARQVAALKMHNARALESRVCTMLSGEGASVAAKSRAEWEKITSSLPPPN